MAKKQEYTYTVGRRRTSSARVRLFRGKGENTVNTKPANEYFPGATSAKILSKPFGVTETSDKYFFSARVVGGGKVGQLEAVVLGIARGLTKLSPDKSKFSLRRAGLLTRDGRIRQRRMVGTGGKARRKKQSPKR
ncbi:MAG: 30S ribosomal protein S9 [Microgenomates group bacterium]